MVTRSRPSSRPYLGQILRAARGAGLDPQRAEELTQATFIRFIEKAEQFEERSHVRTWLFDRHAALPLVMSSEKAGWRERLAVRFHLLRCRHCRRYMAQLRAIGAAAEICGDRYPSSSSCICWERWTPILFLRSCRAGGSERVHIRQVLAEEQEEFYRPSGKTGSPKPGLSVRACHKSQHPLRA